MPLTRLSLWGDTLKTRIKIIFLQDKALLLVFLLSLLLNFALYLLLYFGIKPTLEPLILHYSVYFGIDLIGEWYRLYLMPIVGSFLWLVNFSLAMIFYQKQKVAVYLLGGVILLIEILLIISGALLVWINY